MRRLWDIYNFRTKTKTFIYRTPIFQIHAKNKFILNTTNKIAVE
jgi:hypothetical protein